MTTDPRLHHGEIDYWRKEELAELQNELDRVAPIANAASKLLGDELVSRLLEDEQKRAYEAFCSLPVDATLEQYKGVHLQAVAIRNLKNNLRVFVDHRDKIVKDMAEITENHEQ